MPAGNAPSDPSLQILYTHESDATEHGASAMAKEEPESVVRLNSELGLSCPEGYVCLYLDADANTDGIAIREGEEIGNLANDFDFDWDNRMTSWINNTSTRYCWYFDFDFSGECHVMEPARNRVVNVLPRENDKASSIRPCSGC